MSERLEIIKMNHLISKGGYSTEILKNYRSKNKNKDFIRQCVYGVTENQRYLDFLIDEFSTVKKIDPMVREILRAAIYECILLDEKPYAILNEYVEIAKKHTKYHSFVNAVLRSIVKKKEDLPVPPDSIRYSIHDDLYLLLKRQYQKKALKKILDSYFNKREFLIKIYQKKAIDQLIELGFELEDHPFIKTMKKVRNPSGIVDSEVFRKGYIAIQDGGSALVSEVVSAKKGEIILDICAAPGSKTMNMANDLEGTGMIVANDLYEHKLKRIRENMIRLNIHNITCSCHDAQEKRLEWHEKFDKVLADVPCSGTGICATKPEIKLNRTLKDVLDLVQLQRNIFETAYDSTKMGGSIIYSTCSILKEENEDQMKYFLEKYPIHLKPIEFYGEKNEYIKLMPFQKGTQGFFICQFIKDE